MGKNVLLEWTLTLSLICQPVDISEAWLTFALLALGSVSQCRDDVTERGQGLVDGCSFLQTVTGGPSRLSALTDQQKQEILQVSPMVNMIICLTKQKVLVGIGGDSSHLTSHSVASTICISKRYNFVRAQLCINTTWGRWGFYQGACIIGGVPLGWCIKRLEGLKMAYIGNYLLC